MYPHIKKYCDSLLANIQKIPEARLPALKKLESYLKQQLQNKKTVSVIYICTHNSRRSHFGQIWSTVAASYFNIQSFKSFSGGTEVTSFNINAINALQRTGFKIKSYSKSANPIYEVFYDEDQPPIECFSKVYDHPSNPVNDFAAVMTCSEAETNCPFIAGAESRIALTYDDPKMFDNTPFQDEKYDERCWQIALETFYVFSKINTYV